DDPAGRAGRQVQPVPPAVVRILIVTMYWPPAGGGGVQRPLKFATYLPALGIETHVLAPEDSKWIHRDDELQQPSQAWVHRGRYLGPRAPRPAEELQGKGGLERLGTQASLVFRRALVPDASVTWNATAIPAAIQAVRREQIDVVLTTSPPGSVHLVGAAAKKATGVRWIADLRDSLVAHPHRRAESTAVRGKEKVEHGVARLVPRSADAIVEEARALEPKGRVVTISNGSDFEDFSGLEYHRGERLRITHTGSFFGKRDPKPFLEALASSDVDAVARFVGGFRSEDREWAEQRGLGDRMQLFPYVPRRRSLELQRDSEALLLLIPEAGRAGRGGLSRKGCEYLAARRPILGVVPPDGAAAELLRETGAGIVVAPDDIDGMRTALADLDARFKAGTLDGTPLSDEWRERLSRRTRVEELADLVRSLA